MATTKSAIITVYIYTGTSGSYQSTDLRYTLHKTIIPNQSNIVLEISELVKDYLKVEFSGSSYFSTLYWVTVIANVYDEDDTLMSGSPITKTYLAFPGYGEHTDLINPELSKGLLISNTQLYVPETESVVLPVFAEDLATISFYSNNNLISAITITDSGHSAQKVKYIIAPVGTNKIDYTGTNTGQTILNIKNLCEPLYTPKRVTFLNKFGVLQSIFFDKRSTNRLTVADDKYKQNTIDIEAKSYSVTDPTDVRYNITSNETITVNTGFVDEDFNSVIKELLLSENIWIDHNSNTVPVICKTKNLEFKSSVNNKLINHTIEFEMANTSQNLIR